MSGTELEVLRSDDDAARTEVLPAFFVLGSTGEYPAIGADVAGADQRFILKEDTYRWHKAR